MFKSSQCAPNRKEVITKYAETLTLKVEQRLSAEPACCDFSDDSSICCSFFVDEKIEEINEFASDIESAIASVDIASTGDAVETAMHRLAWTLDRVLDCVDEVKCAELCGEEDVRQQLIVALEKMIHDTISQLRTPDFIETCTGPVFDLDFAEELPLASQSCKPARIGGFGLLLAAFGLGWLMGGD